MATETTDPSQRELQNGTGVKARVSRLERAVDDIFDTLQYLKSFAPDSSYGLFERFYYLEEKYKSLQEDYECLRSSGFHVNEYGDLIQEFYCHSDYYQHNVGHVAGPPGRCDCHDDESSDDVGDITVLPSCRAYYEAGFTHDGIYGIDPDGPNNGVEPFKVWCDQTTTVQTRDGVAVTGGWALFAYHRGGENPKKNVRETVYPDEFAVSENSHWRAIRSTMDYGMMFIDEFNQTTSISMDVLEASTNCHRPSQNPSLVGGRNKVLLWIEDDCNGDGENYCGIALHANRGAGASLFAQCGVDVFDAWPYSGNVSLHEQKELKYFVG